MNNSFQQISEMIDNCLSVKKEEISLALIEKEIILEKIRNLYVNISELETQEYSAPEQKTESSEPARQFTPMKTLDEDVDLFFDTEHESYNNIPNDEELQQVAKEIEEQSQNPQPKPKTEVKQQEFSEELLFDNLEQEEENITVSDEITDNIEELFTDEEIFSEPDTEIELQSEQELELEPELDIENEPEIESDEDIFLNPEPEEAIVDSDTAEEDILLFEEKEEVVPEPISEPEVEQKQNVRTENTVKTESKPEPKIEQKPQQNQRSLNDLFNDYREDNSISGQYMRAKVGDLTKAISINDKFTYIKELFHNKGEDFGSALRQLNECKNMEEAFNCLDDLKQKYYWDTKSDAYLAFCDLLRRKFSN